METLYHATDGPNWKNSTNWLSSAPVGEWYGIQTDNTGRVISIDLSRNGLRGDLPPGLSALESLRYLTLSENQLRGPIPHELGRLGSLVSLDLSVSGLTGRIPPALGNLTELRGLLLQGNRLGGTIPPELGNLGKLGTLWLHENQLSGSIPPELGNLSSLMDLLLYWNQLSGTIPSELGNLGKLELLWLDQNQLSGSIPPELGNLSSLTHLFLSDNQLSGQIPPDLARLSMLENLSVTRNRLTGTIPSAFENHPRTFDLSSWDNQLTGCISERLRNVLSGDSETGLPDCGSRAPVVSQVATSPELTLTAESIELTSDRANVTIYIRVNNNGNGASGSTTLRYYFSNDSTITPRDTQVGTDRVGTIQPDRNSPQSIKVTAPASPFTYYYGACVDAVAGESDTNNNCSTAISFGKPASPDLVVHNLEWGGGAGDVYVGQSLTLQAQVDNIGDGAAGSTTLRYYQSNDATISSRDSQVGTDRVGTVQPGRNSPQSIQLTAPASPGTYYYGACVDAVSGESDTTNNCSAAARVSIGVQTSPDLIVHSMQQFGNSGAVYVGQSLTLQARVENIGDGQSTAATLRYYLSNDTTITSRDTQVGTDRVGTVQPGRNSPQSIQLTAPASPGTYYYGACVDAVSGESDTTNNCSAAARVSIGVQTSPDLIVHSMQQFGNSGAVYVGQSLTLQAQVENIGDGQSTAATLRYYLSNDTTITSRDTQVGTDRVGTVQPGRNSPQSIQLTAPASPGTYYYGACVDAVSGESDTTNNCSAAARVSIGVQTSPDLIVHSMQQFGNSGAVYVGQSLTLQAQVENIGDGQSTAATLRYYLSNDTTITSRDTQVGTDRVGGVQPGRNSPQTFTLTAPSSPGTYYYGACVDSVSGESDTTNNCSSALWVVIGRQTSPDLVVRNMDRSGSGSVLVGQRFNLQAQVENIGDGQSTTTTLRFYRSSDASINTRDVPERTARVGTVQPGRNSHQSTPVTAPSSPGTYYYGACVDAVAGESDTTNNCSSALWVVIGRQTSPDLVVRNMDRSGSGSVLVGQRFNLQAQVENIGDGQSTTTTLRFYRSSDASINTRDVPERTARVGAVQPGRNSPQSTPVTAPSSPGTYYYGACVDAVAGESDTTNNCSRSLPVEVVEPRKVDLLVSSFRVEDTNPFVGDRIVLKARIRNDGNSTSSPSRLDFYQSTNREFTSGGRRLVDFEVPNIEEQLHRDFDHQLRAPSTAGTYYYGVCVRQTANELDTENNCSGPIRVVVVEPAKPDLIIRQFKTNEKSAEPGAQITFTVNVRNQGNARSPATEFIIYMSRSSSSREYSQYAVDVPPIGASPDELEFVVIRPGPNLKGRLYFQACLDAVPGESNTGNNCSTTDYIVVQETDKPDLVTGIRFVGDDGVLYSGAEYKVRVGVRNYGNATSASTTLHFYRSNDRSISQDDVSLGSATLERLGPGESAEKEITKTAPRTSNTSHYYYGCVDEGAGSPGGRCSALFEGEIVDPVYFFDKECTYSNDFIVDNFSFSAEVRARTAVREVRVTGVFVIFFSGLEISRISVDEGFGGLRANQTKEITINRRIANPAHIFSTAECRFSLEWSY